MFEQVARIRKNLARTICAAPLAVVNGASDEKPCN
jgi:hypothetical protein